MPDTTLFNRPLQPGVVYSRNRGGAFMPGGNQLSISKIIYFIKLPSRTSYVQYISGYKLLLHKDDAGKYGKGN